jgi:hypothetical protein
VEFLFTRSPWLLWTLAKQSIFRSSLGIEMLRHDPILPSAMQKWWIEKQGVQDEDATMEWCVL